jgi:hypothetical protein
MSMILLEPAKHDLHNSLEDQAADHLINGDFRKFIAVPRIQNRLALKTRLHGSNVGGETSLSGVILLEMIAT